MEVKNMVKSITLDSFDPLIFFNGTDQEIEAAEKTEAANDKKVVNIARAIKSGRLSYAYIDHFSTGRDGRRWNSRHVLHKSAKYGSDLQVTAVTYIDEVYQYMTYDERVRDNKELTRAFGGIGKTIFFE